MKTKQLTLGDGLGLKVIGGRDIPGTNMIGAYIVKIHPNLSMNGEIREGNSYFFSFNFYQMIILHFELYRNASNRMEWNTIDWYFT